MKVLVDGEKVVELEDWEKIVIKNDIPEEIFNEDMKRRVSWALKHKLENCFHRFQKEWIEKLRNDPLISSIPNNKKEFVEMVCARSDYKNRSQRDEEDEKLNK